MSGTVTNHRRDTLNRNLRVAAERVVKWRDRLKTTWITGQYTKEKEAARRLDQAISTLWVKWLEFPENYRDTPLPAVEEIFRLCDLMDRQRDEAERVEARLQEIGR